MNAFRFVALMTAVVGVFSSDTRLIAQDGECTGAYLLRTPRQVIDVPEAGCEFAARVLVRSDETARGVAIFYCPSRRELLVYGAVFGTVTCDEEAEPTLIVIFARQGFARQDEGGGERDVAIATVRPHPRIPGCDIWHFLGNGVHDADFEAMGTLRLVGGR